MLKLRHLRDSVACFEAHGFTPIDALEFALAARTSAVIVHWPHWPLKYATAFFLN
jgi:hypothetical protein